MRDRGQVTGGGNRLPQLLLIQGAGDARVVLQPERRSSLVVVLIHSTECTECRAFVERLAGVADDLAGWDATVTIVAPQASVDGAAFRAASRFTVLRDPDHALEQAMDMVPAAVIVVDQWQQIQETHEAGAAHDFPELSEIVSWARYLAIQCPECEGEAL